MPRASSATAPTQRLVCELWGSRKIRTRLRRLFHNNAEWQQVRPRCSVQYDPIEQRSAIRSGVGTTLIRSSAWSVVTTCIEPNTDGSGDKRDLFIASLVLKPYKNVFIMPNLHVEKIRGCGPAISIKKFGDAARHLLLRISVSSPQFVPHADGRHSCRPLLFYSGLLRDPQDNALSYWPPILLEPRS